MRKLIFMPWCKIDRDYQVGPIEIVPFRRNAPINDLDDTMTRQVNNVLSIYRDIQGNPITKAALIRYKKKTFVEEYTDAEVFAADDLAELAAFTALSSRKYFNTLSEYCNYDCFQVYIQCLGNNDLVVFRTRRREGHTQSAWPLNEPRVSVPKHCSPIEKVSLDRILLNSLFAYRDTTGTNWGRWQNAISCFNYANTDADVSHHHIEWILFCSAFQRVLNAKSYAKDVATKFADTMQPHQSIQTANSRRRQNHWRNSNQSLRLQWMQEFYRIRGDFAHGVLDTCRNAAWEPSEHLLLASIAFPLLVKTLLVRFSHLCSC